GNVQVCTAAMVYGFKIVQEMADGLSNYMDEMGFTSIDDFKGKAVPTVFDWQYLNLNHISKAVINQDSCIQCGRCHIACEDTSHQAIMAVKDGKRHFEVKEDECVGCNLCTLVCPVPECITLRHLMPGEVDLRTQELVCASPADWTTHPNNPMRLPTTVATNHHVDA
ncbi:MAG: 4Fe-4S dicluster-binding protein, partial [Propionivibrio sp.]